MAKLSYCLEEEYFHSLNIGKIKKDGVHTFKMKVLTGQASEETLNTILKEPFVMH